MKNNLNKPLLFDVYERAYIIDYYKRAKGKSKWWLFNNKDLIISNYEMMKNQRNFARELEKLLNFSFNK
jgi:hypothetical protein